MSLIPGNLYRITQDGKPEPGLYRFIEAQPAYCQLHGEPMGHNFHFWKLRGTPGQVRYSSAVYVYAAPDQDNRFHSTNYEDMGPAPKAGKVAAR